MHRRGRSSGWRSAARWLVNLAVAAVVAGALTLIWPQSLGGRIAYVKVDGHSMDPTLHMGDLAVVHRHAHYGNGDVVAYRVPRDEFGAGAFVIHRIIGGDGRTGFTTQGDNRTAPDIWHPRDADILGVVTLRVPGIGDAIATLASPIPLGGLCAGLTTTVMLLPASRRRSGDGDASGGASEDAVREGPVSDSS
jgi:signal peptidase